MSSLHFYEGNSEKSSREVFSRNRKISAFIRDKRHRDIANLESQTFRDLTLVSHFLILLRRVSLLFAHARVQKVRKWKYAGNVKEKRARLESISGALHNSPVLCNCSVHACVNRVGARNHVVRARTCLCQHDRARDCATKMRVRESPSSIFILNYHIRYRITVHF